MTKESTAIFDGLAAIAKKTGDFRVELDTGELVQFTPHSVPPGTPFRIQGKDRETFNEAFNRIFKDSL